MEQDGLPGLEAARALSAMQDAIIQVIYDFAVKHFYYAQNPTAAERITIVATGGYGRGELAPGSDVDLLFVRPFKQTAWGESVIEFILYMLWDLGLKVGHATRSLAECVRLAKQDITIRTALLEARYLWGDQRALRRAAQEILDGGRHRLRPGFRRSQARRARRAPSPPGRKPLSGRAQHQGRQGRAARPADALLDRQISLSRRATPPTSIQHNVFTKDEYKTFQKAEAFLWDVRVQLHYLLGRAEERLSFDVQPGLAAALGYQRADKPRHAVEAFMRAYFLVAKDVGDLTRIFCAALEEQNKKRRAVARAASCRASSSRAASSDDFFVENGRLNARPAHLQARSGQLSSASSISPTTKSIDIHPDALRTITRSLDLITDDLRANPEANRLFLEILSSRHDPERALRMMNEAGVFGRFVPEFGRVVGLMQFNMYHHYTVDEHLIRAVGNVASIERGEHREEHPLATDIIKRIKSREVLYCAILLHDIAKGLPGDHSDVGAAIANSLCPRLGLSPDDTDAVAWLVKNHLVMSDTAQRRDISDPKTVQRFRRPGAVAGDAAPAAGADRRRHPRRGTGRVERLEGPAAARTLFRGRSSDVGRRHAPARGARVEEAKAGAGRAPRRSAGGGARARCCRAITTAIGWPSMPTTQERHARLMPKADARGRAARARRREQRFPRRHRDRRSTRPTIPGLFSQIRRRHRDVGRLDRRRQGLHHLRRLRARRLLGAGRRRRAVRRSPSGSARLRQTIEKTLRGEIWPRRADRQAAAAKPRPAPSTSRPRVHFDNEASQIATVVEVRGPGPARLPLRRDPRRCSNPACRSPPR